MKARPPMQDYADIREEVAKLCAAFPGPYWQAKDRARAYPSEFVAALGKAGYLAALIPEEYGGAGLPLSAGAASLEEIQRQGRSEERRVGKGCVSTGRYRGAPE